jgi:demethylmenaquinone methyltransferase/2-methoxy-6-polyprenyl-1,4-benzoquinol methylase
LASGTGLWTERLARTARHITALDSAPEALALNRRRLIAASLDGRVEYVEADLFGWQPSRCYDVVFFSFWLSHVPPERFAEFWALVRACLAPTGRIFFLDSLYDETSTARDHQLPTRAATTLTRRLNDGREFTVIKVFYAPEEVEKQLTALDWEIAVRATPHYFLYGFGRLAGDH